MKRRYLLYFILAGIFMGLFFGNLRAHASPAKPPPIMSTITINNTQFAIVFVIIIVFGISIFAEWKRDFIYFFISALAMLELTLYSLSLSGVSIIVSIVIMSIAIYHTILGILHLPGVRDMVIEFREHLKGN